MAMTAIPVPPASAALTANGTSAGVVTVASTTPFYAGAEAFVKDDNSTGVKVIITRLLSSTTMQCRPLLDADEPLEAQKNAMNYAAGGDLSAYTTAQNARIEMPSQVVRVRQKYVKLDLE